jgi:hypothetical protein
VQLRDLQAERAKTPMMAAEIDRLNRALQDATERASRLETEQHRLASAKSASGGELTPRAKQLAGAVARVCGAGAARTDA